MASFFSSKFERKLEECNVQQKSAITSDCNLDHLIVAGAGSGKTRVLTLRIEALLEFGICPEKILALSFTRDSAQEMRDRLSNELSADNNVECLTFHSLAFQLLRRKSAQFYWKTLGHSSFPSVVDGEPNEGEVDLDSLIHHLNEYLNVFAKDLKDESWSQILVDEAQDMNLQQLNLLITLCSWGAKIFVVGDDQQSIYGFRGAYPDVLGRVQKKWLGIKLIKLEINYRSTSSILKFCNKIFDREKSCIEKKLLPGRRSSHKLFCKNSPVRKQVFVSGYSEINWIANQIKSKREKYAVNWNEFAVLCRLQLIVDYVKAGLSDLGIPVLEGGVVVSTIHASKGLQYPVVFLSGMAESLFPYFEAKSKLSLEYFLEERRLFYVAATRAEFELFLLFSKSRVYRGKFKYFKPSRFIRML